MLCAVSVLCVFYESNTCVKFMCCVCAVLCAACVLCCARWASSTHGTAAHVTQQHSTTYVYDGPCGVCFVCCVMCAGCVLCAV